MQYKGANSAANAGAIDQENGQMKDLFRIDGSALGRREFVQMAAAFGVSLDPIGGLLTSRAEAAQQPPADTLPAGSRFVEGTGGELLVEQLCANGERYIFTCESSGTTPIWDVVVERRDIDVIIAPHEAGAAAVAFGYALASHHVPFSICDSAGFLNKLTPIAATWFGRIPAVYASERSPSSGFGGLESSEDHDQFLEPAAPFTKWRWTIDAARRIPELMRRAYQFAANPPAGPVTLAFPNNLLEQGGVRAEIIPMKPNPTPAVAPAPALVDQAARLLLDATNPLVVAGPEIVRYDAERQAVELAETLGMAATYLRFNCNYCPFPSRHPLFLGQLQRGMRVPTSPDVVLFLGGRMPSEGAGIPRGAHIIQVTTDARSIGRERAVDVGIVADPLHAAASLSAAVRAMATAQRLQEMARLRTDAVRSFKVQADRSRQEAAQFARARGALGWDVMFAEMERTLDRNALLVQETAPYADPMYWFDFGRDRKTLITPHTSQPGALGMGLGVAIGAQLAEPNRQVVLFTGDGAMLFSQLEMLWTAARYRAPITVIVFNNRSYDLPRRRKLDAGGRQFQLGQELTSYLGDPDVNFATIAEAFGVKGEVLSDPREIASALRRAANVNRDGQPYLIDALVERRGLLAESTWHSPFTIAGLRTPGVR